MTWHGLVSHDAKACLGVVLRFGAVSWCCNISVAGVTLVMSQLPPASACCIWGVQIRTIERVCEIPHEGPFCDLMWSDPEETETWAISPRGAGWLFGARVAAEFNQINGLELICRAHQLVQEGLKYMFPPVSLLILWRGFACGLHCHTLCDDICFWSWRKESACACLLGQAMPGPFHCLQSAVCLC